MARSVAFLVLSILCAAPALAQVINGETPLDETTLNRETPGPAVQTPPPAIRSPSDVAAPAHRDLLQAAPRRD